MAGRLGRAHGVRGAMHVRCSLESPELLAGRRHWLVARPGAGGGQSGGAEGSGREWSVLEVEELRPGTRGEGTWVVRFQGVEDREQAQRLTGLMVGVPRSALPPAEENEYYWSDLLGAKVVTSTGEPLGVIERLLETGAHDVMVIRDGPEGAVEERLIPFVPGVYVERVCVEQGLVVVDWDPAWDAG